MTVSPEGRCALLTKPVPETVEEKHLFAWPKTVYQSTKKSTSKKAASNDAAFSVILL